MTIRLGNENEFFEMGRKVAGAADAGKTPADEVLVTFGDATDMMKMLTPARLALVAQVKVRPDSIQGLASRLHRDRSAVKRDLDDLVRAGVLLVESKVMPGHGRMKFIQAPARQMVLQAIL